MAHPVLGRAALQAVLRRDDGEVDAAVVVAVPERRVCPRRSASVVVLCASTKPLVRQRSTRGHGASAVSRGHAT